MVNTSNENIKHESSKSKKKSSDDKDDMKWYVYRYRTFSNEIKKLSTFSDGDVKVFMPIVEENKASKAQNGKSNRPVLPGFFFVYASRSYLQKSEKFKQYPALKSYCDQPRHIFIKEEDMNAFLHIAAVLAENPVLVYSEEFDQQAYNIVTFTDSFQEQRFAFLETSQGMKGGFLIVPIHQEEMEKAIYGHKELDKFQLPPGSLCYKQPVSQSMFNIIHIAGSNKHDLDYISDANKIVSDALQHFSTGKAIEEKTLLKLKEYIRRYRKASTKSIKFQAKIFLMLYKCSIILKLAEESCQFKKEIEESIIPAYKRYVEGVRKDNRPTTQKGLDKFMLAFEKVQQIEAATRS